MGRLSQIYATISSAQWTAARSAQFQSQSESQSQSQSLARARTLLGVLRQAAQLKEKAKEKQR